MTLELWVVPDLPEIAAGDDIVAQVLEHADPPLADGDILVVTSKIVSKAAGLVVHGSRSDLLAAQTDRVVAQRGPMQIVRTWHGLTMAAAGVDASNTPLETAVPLPPDPDASARRIRSQVLEQAGVRVGVVVTDTAGRAWRYGQTDLAIGLAGVVPYLSMEGATDDFGNTLTVTAPAVADEIAAAGDLVKAKLTQTPVAVLRGAPDSWLLNDDGPGAVALVRPEDADLFGLGAVDAVVAATVREAPVRGFPAPEQDALERVLSTASAGLDQDLVTLRHPRPGAITVDLIGDFPAAWLEAGRAIERLWTLAVALGVEVEVDAAPARDL